MLKTLHPTVRDPVAEKLPLVDQPALVVCGGRDPIAPRRWAEEVTRLLPRGRLAFLPHAGHVLPHSTPEAPVRAIFPFLLEAVTPSR